jgi:small subunit ribosomal protein S18e
MSTGRIQIKVESNFKYILRLFNTNVDGKQKIPFAIRSVRGIGRRLAILVTKKAGLDVNGRAGDLSEEQLEKIVEICNNPTNYSIPDWFLNRKRDPKEGNYTQMIANQIETKLREDLEKMKRMKLHKGLRHYYGLRVRGQHTCSTGRRGKIVGVEKKK